MKTKIYQEIDGYKIIVGIGEAQIDGELTKPIANEKLKETDEYKAVENIGMQITAEHNARREALKNYHAAIAKSDKQKATYEYQKAVENITALENELKPLAVTLKQKFTDLMRENAVYFKMVNAEVITDAEAVKISDALSKYGLVDIDLKEVVDNRGITVWKKTDKWYSRTIRKIGEGITKDEIINLTPEQEIEIEEQFDNERIAKLTSIEKQDEFNLKVNMLQETASIKKSGMIISGVSENKATADIKAWYDDEFKKLNVKYGI